MNTFLDPNVPYIKLFGIEHLSYVLIIVSLLILVILNRKRLRIYAKQLRIILLMLTLFQQVLLYSWYVIVTGFDFAQALPLHLCRISTLLSLIYFIRKNNDLMDIVFYFGLFAYGSFALPIAIHPITHALGISYLINHSLTLLLPFIAYYAFDWKPKRKNLHLAISYFLIYFIIAVVANTLFDGNYFYLVKRPFLSQMNVYIYYLITIIFTITVFIIVFHFISRFMKNNEK